jgi:hypothetical protein
VTQQYLPKKTDLGTYEQSDLDAIIYERVNAWASAPHSKHNRTSQRGKTKCCLDDLNPGRLFQERVLLLQAGDFLGHLSRIISRGRGTSSRAGPGALGAGGLCDSSAQGRFVDGEVAGDFGSRIAEVGDHRDGVGFELG